jgi:hypothetical protein
MNEHAKQPWNAENNIRNTTRIITIANVALMRFFYTSMKIFLFQKNFQASVQKLIAVGI